VVFKLFLHGVPIGGWLFGLVWHASVQHFWWIAGLRFGKLWRFMAWKGLGLPRRAVAFALIDLQTDPGNGSVCFLGT
jgi:hypothetical protein